MSGVSGLTAVFHAARMQTQGGNPGLALYTKRRGALERNVKIVLQMVEIPNNKTENATSSLVLSTAFGTSGVVLQNVVLPAEGARNNVVEQLQWQLNMVELSVQYVATLLANASLTPSIAPWHPWKGISNAFTRLLATIGLAQSIANMEIGNLGHLVQ